jgi:Domain of unknown function (DUF1707)
VRASDQERDQALDALAEHARTNRITLAEFDERAAVVSAAQGRDDINALFDDLPEPKPHFDRAERPEPQPRPGSSVPEVATREPASLPVPAGRRAVGAAAYGLFMSSGATARPGLQNRRLSRLAEAPRAIKTRDLSPT